ncbi:MAG TPA: transposase [Mycobacteriales bacterium]|nr:transposase [Mycobacteriales bacterium]
MVAFVICARLRLAGRGLCDPHPHSVRGGLPVGVRVRCGQGPQSEPCRAPAAPSSSNSSANWTRAGCPSTGCQPRCVFPTTRWEHPANPCVSRYPAAPSLSIRTSKSCRCSLSPALSTSPPYRSVQARVRRRRAESDRIVPSPRRLTSWIMSRPQDLSDKHRAHLGDLLAACPEMTALVGFVGEFAQLMAERRGSDLDSWAAHVRAAGLSEMAPFLNGPEADHDAAVAGLSVPHSNGPTEGINTKTKLIKRQMYRRAGFHLLRHRILLP